MVEIGEIVEYVRSSNSIVKAIVVDIHGVYFHNRPRKFIGPKLYDLVTLEDPVAYVVDVQERKLIAKSYWEKFFEKG